MDPVTSKVAGKAVSITLGVVTAVAAVAIGWVIGGLYAKYKQGDVIRAMKARGTKPSVAQPVEVI